MLEASMLPKSCIHKVQKNDLLLQKNVAFIIITLETHLCMSTIFLLFATIRD